MTQITNLTVSGLYLYTPKRGLILKKKLFLKRERYICDPDNRRTDQMSITLIITFGM